MTQETTTTPKQALLDAVRQNAAQLAQIEAIRENLYGARDRLVWLGRAMTPPVTQRELAEAAGVSETVIVKIERRSESWVAQPEGLNRSTSSG